MKREDVKNIERAIIAFLIIVVVVLFVYLIKGYFGINEGDKVRVDYTLYVDDVLYETTIMEEAKNSGIYDENKVYKPFEFVIGSGVVLKGFEDAVKTMGVNDEKIITLLPSEAYGEMDEKKIVNGLRRVVNINKTSFINLNSFKELFGKEPVLNEFVKDLNMPWEIKVIGVGDGNVIVENMLVKGQKIVLPGSEWDSIVEDVSGNSVSIKQYPKVGDFLVIPGETILRARVINVKNESFDVDLNHPLAGKTLRFKIILIDIKK